VRLPDSRQIAATAVFYLNWMKEVSNNMGNTPTRQDAMTLLKKYNQNDALIKHALAVEAVMAHFADLYGDEDLEKWRVIGLIHDLDYEKYPEEHCHKTKEILTEEGWPEDYIRAVISHGWKICTDVEPVEKIEKVLYTIDELTGLIVATVLMRPSRSIMDLTVKSVMKKYKNKNFAAGVDRQIIEEGAALLGMDLNEVIEETIKGMQAAAEELGLRGEL
jgi:putative nucleotidyltransferase with HDIG domain